MAMKKYNFIRVITFISVLLLIFAQSVYDPSVHAKMQKIEDESLSDISGESLYTGFNWTVRAVATNGLSIGDGTTNPDSINIGALEIGQGNTMGGNFSINTTVRWDIGSSGGQVWHLGGGFVFPSNPDGLGVFAYNNIWVRIDNGTPVTIGYYAQLLGLYVGRELTNITPNYLPYAGSSYTSPWVIISNHGGENAGFKFFGEVGAYLQDLVYVWNTNASTSTAVIADGVYVYGLMNETISNPTSPGSWTSRNGMMKIGGTFPTYNTGGSIVGTLERYGTVDVGTSGGKTVLSLNLPMAGSIRIKNVSFGTGSGTLNWGPIALDDIIFYTNRVNIRDL